MPLGPNNTRTFHRTLYAGELQTITLLKGGDDQQEGVFTKYTLFECRFSMIFKAGEPLQGDMSADHYRVCHIPRIQLDTAGIAYINALDRIIDNQGRVWQPESSNELIIKLFENHVCVACRRADFPNPTKQQT